MNETSHYLFKGPCPDCGSSDACANYSDGHTHCFACSKTTPGDGAPDNPRRKPAVRTEFTPVQGDIRPLQARGISQETCAHFGYSVGRARMQVEPGEYREVPVHIAPYYREGALVAQHLRDASKNFAWTGTAAKVELFGQHLWRDGGKKVVITEGEIDCMTVSQLQGNKWPVVSIPSGSNSAKKAIQDNLEWLERFEEVILMYDMDDPGRDAVADCAPLFSPGRCKVASLPKKDANECLQAGLGAAVIEAIWGAKAYRPDGILSIEDLAEEAEKDVPFGVPWFLPSLTKATFGRRDGELYAIGAGTGCGKTDWFTQSIAYDVMELGIMTGVIYLEQPPVETVRRIAGKVVGKNLHIPGEATVDERREAINLLKESGNLQFYGKFGAADWAMLSGKIRYMAVSLGCRHIYLDHLTALVANEEDERKALDSIMEKMATLALDLKVKIHYISHLTRPSDGKPHEEGGRVMIRHFRGSNAIGMWSHFMFGIERNQQADDPEDRFTTFRVLKDRNTGRATGMTIKLGYDVATGRLYEDDSVANESPFSNRTTSSTTPPWEA